MRGDTDTPNVRFGGSYQRRSGSAPSLSRRLGRLGAHRGTEGSRSEAGIPDATDGLRRDGRPVTRDAPADFAA